MRRTALILVLLAASAHAETRALDEFFKGEVVDFVGRRVVVHYDFSHPSQLDDFEVVALEGLCPEGGGSVRVEGGRLLLEGSVALVHRTRGEKRLHAGLQLRSLRRRDQGTLFLSAEPGALLLDLFDQRLRGDGALVLAAVRPGAKDFRTVASAKGAEVARQFAGDKPVPIEVAKQGEEEFFRIGSLYRNRSSKDQLPGWRSYRFGVWVADAALSIEDLVLTIELPGDYLAEHALRCEYARDAAVREASVASLVQRIRRAPLGAEARTALRELSRRGPDGWQKLFRLVKELSRKRGYTALPAVEALGKGPEKERLDLLVALYDERGPVDLRFAVLRAMAPFYPAQRDLLHAGLRIRLPGRDRYFRELVRRGLAEDVLKDLLHDDELADEAYGVLRDRHERLEASGNIPRFRALEAHSPSAARALLEEFRQKPDWKLVEALIGLLRDDEPRVVRGAHLLLMTLSGKDLPADPDLWRSWFIAKRDRFEPPDLSAPGLAAAAIQRGVLFLKKDLAKDGAAVWPMNPDWPGCRVGATALAVYALRAAEVPADDPAVRKAVRSTLLVIDPVGNAAIRGDLDDYTYALSLLALALSSLDRALYRPHLEWITQRLIEGQLQNGQWTYHCRDRTSPRRPKAGDNSNTQYAILALRAARRAGVEVPRRIWSLNAAYWRDGANRFGGWGYGPGDTTLNELSMTSAGVSSLAICVEALFRDDPARRLDGERRALLGLRRLGELLLENGFKGQELYAYYGVERTAILTGTRAFEHFDWYREGASEIVATQKENGAWGKPDARGVTTGEGYGEAIDTAYALLFLKRAVTGLAGASGDGIVRVPAYRRKQRAGASGPDRD